MHNKTRAYHPTYWLIVCIAILVVSGCSSKPLLPHSDDTTPMILVPASMAGVTDGRTRFREIFCAITKKRGKELPDYRPCDNAIVRMVNEQPSGGKPVELGDSNAPLKILIVLGLGATCIENFLDSQMTVVDHLTQFGHEVSFIEIEALSSSKRNAQIIRESVLALPAATDNKRLVLVGYSKGVPDILEAVVNFPELQQRVSAVVSITGVVGGSPVANSLTQSTANLFQYVPKADCDKGDQGGLESLKTHVRKKWLADHSLPESIRYYSVITYPDVENISTMLKSSYNKLKQVDARNDSQLIFYDQLLPGSVLLGYLNADHWAVALPINRSHPFISSTFIDKNAFPREVLSEAIIRFVEEDLDKINSY